MLDTNIAIYLRDKHIGITDRVSQLDGAPLLSIITRIELENGVYADPIKSAMRRPRVDAMLATMTCLDFDERAADAYRRIVAALGYSRTRVLDRMIAAQAIGAEAALITINGDDFVNIPSLRLEVWPSPA